MRREKVAHGWDGHFRRIIIHNWLFIGGLMFCYIFLGIPAIFFINSFRAEDYSL